MLVSVVVSAKNMVAVHHYRLVISKLIAVVWMNCASNMQQKFLQHCAIFILYTYVS